MELHVGTSGYSYPEWIGSFYPEKIRKKEMLPFYAQHFAAVELNNSFRKLPTPSSVAGWMQQVPEEFQFSLKAPQAITHFKRLKDCDAATSDLLRVAQGFKQRLGPILFQLPPNFKKDLPRLSSFLKRLGKKTRAAFEFRHASWFDDDVFDCLRRRGIALCLAEKDDGPNAPLVSTTDWGYLRLRRERYTARQICEWVKNVQAQKWSAAYVFFMHEETGQGPKLARKFLGLASKRKT